MNTVFDLWYVRGYSNREDTELHIGVFSAQEKAQAAIEQLRQKPGFQEWPDGFEIHEIALDHVTWPEGFKSVIGPKPEDVPLEAFDMPFWPDKNKNKVA
jgi:homoserine kinase type II